MRNSGVWIVVLLMLGFPSVGETETMAEGLTSQMVQDLQPGDTAQCSANGIGMMNPAALYCQNLGYIFELVEGKRGQEGICRLPDGESCEAWSFLEGRCGTSYSYCALQGYQVKTIMNGNGSLSSNFAVCIGDEGQEVGRVSDLMGLSALSTRGDMTSQASQAPEYIETSRTGAKALPASIDWRNFNGQNWMTAVKDQGSCGSCWAFSAVGVVEAVYNIATQDPGLDLDLSEQYLVSDCYGSDSCCGGWHDDALDYVKNNGITDEGCFPYADGGCQSTCFIQLLVNQMSNNNPTNSLEVLRSFRDQYLSSKTVRSYYEYARDVREILLSNPILLLETGDLMLRFLPAIEAMVGAEGGRAVTIETEDADRLLRVLDTLREEVDQRREVLGDAKVFGLGSFLDEISQQVSFAVGRNFTDAFNDSSFARLESQVGKDLSPASRASLQCDCNCTYDSGGNGDVCSNKTCSDRCSDWSSRLHTIVNRWGVSTSPADIKQNLVDHGPLAVALGIGDNFKGYFDNGIYRCGSEEYCQGLSCTRANHAVIMVGFNDPGSYWIIRNSWGSGWHDGGYYKLGYDECSVDRYVHAISVNHPPVADADGPYTASEGSAITFDGSGSWDPDGDSLEYRWDFDANGSWDTSWSSSPTASKTWPDDHSGSARLQVSDGRLTDVDSTTVRVTNVAPAVTATGDAIAEGEQATVTASFTDPGVLDWHTATVNWGDGSPTQSAPVNQASGSGTLSASHIYGDNGSYNVTVTVTDDDGGRGSTVAVVTVINLLPTVSLHTSDAINFAGGLVFVGRVSEPQTHGADAEDPGSDDLDFLWNFGANTVYFNDGTGPDPLPSPWGTFPFTATDSAEVTFDTPGWKLIEITVTDDDGGQASAELAKLVTGGDCTCTRSMGFWKHQFGRKPAHIDHETLQTYLDLIDFTSAVFSEIVPAATLTEARSVLWNRRPEMKYKAQAQALAAWLNATHGCILWSEMIDTDGDGAPDQEFLSMMTEIEQLLGDIDSDHADYVRAKDLAEAINLHDESNPECAD